jgi:hypothetical protein
MKRWTLLAAAMLPLLGPAAAQTAPAEPARAGFYDAARKRLETVRSRFAAQRESALAARARMQDCRAQAQQPAPRPAGTRLTTYRDCLARG